MILIIGVRFRKSGKVYYFDPANLQIHKGDHVIVETARGVEYGTVVLGPKEVTDDKVVSPLKPVLRLATEKDAATNLNNERKEEEAFQICLEKIHKHNLNMKLIDSEYTFDRNKLLFYFTADGRIDFRELVKDLASVFRTRIELRQIGVRDETKLIGGMSICGRPLCCHSYLADFAPVSIKMAKEQNLSLNPAKISGVCGRLMCCLKNEQEAYEYLNSTLPSIGTYVSTSDGYRGEVQSVSVLKQQVKVVITKEKDEKEVREYHVDELTFDRRKKAKGAPIAHPLPDATVRKEDIEHLKRLEKEDMAELSEEAEPARPKNNRRRPRNNNQNKNNTNNNRNQNQKADLAKHSDGPKNAADKPHADKPHIDKPKHNNDRNRNYNKRGNNHTHRGPEASQRNNKPHQSPKQ